jgi:hypothetical protein
LAESPQALETPQTSVELAEPVQWLRSRPVLAIGVLLILANVWWKASLLGKSFFRLDDWFYLERASTEGLTGKYLFWINAGHLDVVGTAIVWVTQRLGPDDWTLASAVILVLLACTCLALLRMLRTLFGDRPGVLLVLALYMLSPLALPGLAWYTVVLEQLPLQIAIFCAVTAHVHYLRTKRYRHAVAAAAWLVVAMLSSLQGAAVVVLLFALTSAFFADGAWSRAVWRVLRAHWRAWLLYVALTAGYVVVYLFRLKTSAVGVSKPPSWSFVFTYAGTLLRNTFVPGAFGGPWRWTAPGVFYGVDAATGPPQVLAWVSWLLAIVVVIVSLVYAWDAWRGWVIIAGWFIVVDIVPVLAGRSTLFNPSPAGLGSSARYVWDGTAVLALCLGLAFMPLVGSPRPLRSPRRLGRAEFAAATTVMVAIVCGSLWSYSQFPVDQTAGDASGYIATARAALTDAPSGTMIVDNLVSADVIGISGSLFSEPAFMASSVLSPLLSGPPGDRPRFITQPDGTYKLTKQPDGTRLTNLWTFNKYGQLVPTSVVGYGSATRCWPSKGGMIVVPLSQTAPSVHMVQIDYVSGNSGQMLVTFGTQTVETNFQRGFNRAFVPIDNGISDRVIIQPVSGTLPGCVGNAVAGGLYPASAPTIPAAPLP